MMNKCALLVIVSLLLCSLASAASFEVTTKSIKNAITIDEVAEYELTIHNNLQSVRDFKIKTLDWPNWDVYTRPLMNPLIVNVGRNASRTVKLYVDPMHIMSGGTTDVNVQVSLEGSEEKGVVPLRVSVSSVRSAGQYVSTVIPNIKVPTEINPMEDVIISIYLDNQNIINYDNLIISFESNTINADFETSLNSSEKKSEEMIVKLDPKTEPQDDVVTITIYSDGKAISKPMTAKVKIISYSELVVEEEIKTSILGRSREIVFTNEGNIENPEVPSLKTSALSSFFTSTEPRAMVVSREHGKYLEWDEKIAPHESLEVTVTENYVLLIILVILTALVAIIYYKTKSPLVVLKSSADLKVKEGGVSELNVILTVRNTSKDKIDDIKVSDKIPHIAKLERDITIGTLKPVNVLTHETKGALIKWVIESLNPEEERLIKYKVRLALPIIGEFTLSAATVKFNHKGRQRTVKSNGLTIHS